MISFVEGTRRREWLETAAAIDPLSAAAMDTMTAVYGMDAGVADCWLATGSTGRPETSLMRFDGRMRVADGPEQSVEELTAFLEAVGGFHTLEASPALCQRLAGRWSCPHTGSLTMEYAGGVLHGEDSRMDSAPPLRQVFDLLVSGGGQKAGAWDTWYPHTSHVVRHGLGFAAVLYEDGIPAATGGVYTTGVGCGVIGSVFTRESFRGRGLAGAVVRHLCRRCREKGLRPVLYCAEDSLEAFYRRLGFVPLGTWARIQITCSNGGKSAET